MNRMRIILTVGIFLAFGLLVGIMVNRDFDRLQEKDRRAGIVASVIREKKEKFLFAEIEKQRELEESLQNQEFPEKRVTINKRLPDDLLASTLNSKLRDTMQDVFTFNYDKEYNFFLSKLIQARYKLSLFEQELARFRKGNFDSTDFTDGEYEEINQRGQQFEDYAKGKWMTIESTQYDTIILDEAYRISEKARYQN